jgi:hypothetical protein
LRDGRLITDILRKETHRWYGFFANPQLTKGPDDDMRGAPALQMPKGYEDFPGMPLAEETD